MRSLFITSDQIGSETGGGVVTHNELEALRSISETVVVNPPASSNPFKSDILALVECQSKGSKFNLAHFYSGTYSQTITHLKSLNIEVSYTCAAHDIEISREEHLALGMSFDLPHLNEEDLRERYLSGYRNADYLICPSTQSKAVMERFGCQNIKVIPHGCHVPQDMKSLPKKFTVGYLGQIGPDKGLIYLIKAWAMLRYKEYSLILAGRDSELLLPCLRAYGGGNVQIAGFVKSVDNFYHNCSVYVQPSATEGFGIEVLEAMSHGRPVICSDGAGASDCITNGVDGFVVPKRNPEAIAKAIDTYRNDPELLTHHSKAAREKSKQFTWDKIRTKYCELWEKA